MNTHSSSAYSSAHRSYYKKPFRKTKGFYILLVIIILVAGFIYWSIQKTEDEANNRQKYSDQDNIPITAAKLIYSTGTIEIKTEDQPWQEIGDNYQIQMNDIVRTNDAARAVIELPDKSQIRLSEKSELRITQMGMSDVVIEQISGTAFHRVNSESTAIYRVTNGNTEITALGTAFNTLVSSKLTYVTVTEGKIKLKIYDQEDIINMRTVEQGTKASVNPTLEFGKMIQTEEVSIADLLNDSWYAWNLERDREENHFLGVFEKAVPLVLTEPAETKTQTDSEKVTIKGQTDPGAEIFMSGQEVDNNQGSFETDYLLSPGENEIEITVKKGKNLNKKTIFVTSNKQKIEIILKGSKKENTVALEWTTDSIDNLKEYKVVQANAENPTFPNNPYHTIESAASSDQWAGLVDGDYFFRVCAYSTDGKCLAYSNNYNASIGAGEKTTGQINLNASADKDDVSLSWSISNDINPAEGFKSIISQTKDPAYPGNSYHSLNSNERNDTWKKLSPAIYFFRVCLLKNNQCVVYSNNANITVTETAPTGTITLSGTSTGGQINLNWQVSDLEITKGFKSIISETPGVSFPGQGHHLLTSASETTDVWAGLESGKTYYFSVCQNLGSVCGTYSNEISLEFK